MRKDFFNEKTENIIYNRQASTIDKRRKSINPDRLPAGLKLRKSFATAKLYNGSEKSSYLKYIIIIDKILQLLEPINEQIISL